MSLLIKRSFHNKRIPNYNGYWSLILEQANTNKVSVEFKQPISIPIVNETIPEIPIKKKAAIVYLQGKPVELPEKPDAPDNCCMSGCVNCVWDLYQEDMEEYNMKKKELRNQFIAANEPVPKELATSSKVQDPFEGMDPTMRAFLEMEKKLQNK